MGGVVDLKSQPGGPGVTVTEKNGPGLIENYASVRICARKPRRKQMRPAYPAIGCSETTTATGRALSHDGQWAVPKVIPDLASVSASMYPWTQIAYTTLPGEEAPRKSVSCAVTNPKSEEVAENEYKRHVAVVWGFFNYLAKHP